MSNNPQAASSETSKGSGNPTSPKRPKHLSTHSITDVTGHHHKHHHHHHHHHPHIHHRDKNRDRENSGKEAKEGRDGGSGKGEGNGAPRSEGHPPSDSRSTSRQGSVLGEDGNTARAGLRDANGRGERLVRERDRAVKAGAVGEEREKGALRAAELRNALNALNTLSNDTTRRLDHTYYSVLEKLAALNSTISSLRELADLTRGLTEEFQTDASELTDDATAQLEGFHHLHEQEARINGLKARIGKGREKINALTERVARVSNRVEGWETAEKEWQDKTRKRLRLLWVVVSLAILLAAVLVGVQYSPGRAPFPARGVDATPEASNATELLGPWPSYAPAKRESSELKEEVLHELAKGGRGGDEAEEDPRLKVFDEL